MDFYRFQARIKHYARRFVIFVSDQSHAPDNLVLPWYRNLKQFVCCRRQVKAYVYDNPGLHVHNMYLRIHESEYYQRERTYFSILLVQTSGTFDAEEIDASSIMLKSNVDEPNKSVELYSKTKHVGE